jgi:hypothetical protein
MDGFDKAIVEMACLIIIGTIIFLLITYFPDLQETSDNEAPYNKKDMYTACERGCIWSHGFEVNESPLGYADNVTKPIFSCMFRCADVYWYGKNE